MKDWISILVQIGPIYLMIWWLGRRHGHQNKMILRDGGPALVASGICSLIGAKYFGLSVFGKTTVSQGEDAIGASLLVIGLGIAAFVFHYILFALIPTVWRLLRHERKKG